MIPSDWVADCMIPEAWMHDPFTLDGTVVTCDGLAVIGWPRCRETFPAPRFDEDQDETERLRSSLWLAREGATGPLPRNMNDLGLIEQHLARLKDCEELYVDDQGSRLIFHAWDKQANELFAYGVIYKGAQAA